MKKLFLLIAVLVTFISTQGQTLIEFQEHNNFTRIPTGNITPISTTKANEKSPFITGHENDLYAVIEVTDTSRLTNLALFYSSDGGANWQYKKTLKIDGGNSLSPQGFYFKDRFYVVFKYLTPQEQGIIVYEAGDKTLDKAGDFSKVISTTDTVISPSIIVKYGKTGSPIIFIAYYNFTTSEFYILKGTIDNGFLVDYSRTFGHPDGGMNIDATSGLGRDMFAFNAKIQSQDQIIVIEHTYIKEWAIKFITRGDVEKFNPVIDSYAEDWIVTYQSPTAIRYFGQFRSYGIIKDEVLEPGATLPAVGITETPAGKIAFVFKKNGRLFKRFSTIENPTGWSDEVAMFADTLKPGGKRISLIPDNLNGGVAFASLNRFGDYDVYFSSLTPEVAEIPAPSDLTAMLSDSTDVLLQWTDNSENEKGFKIFRMEKGIGYWMKIDSVKANETSFHDTTVKKNRSYFYKVRAFGEESLSKFSAFAQVKTPQGKVPNVFYYRLNVLLKNTSVGNIYSTISEGTMVEDRVRYIPPYRLNDIFASASSPYGAVAGSYFKIGNISDDDLFLDMLFVYDFNTRRPPTVKDRKLFFYFIVNVYKMPGYVKVDTTYKFNAGEYFYFSFPRQKNFTNFLDSLNINPDSVGFAYITPSGFDTTGIKTVITKDYVKFRASHFSKFGGGRHSITSDVERVGTIPKSFSLGQNYPNPFSSGSSETPFTNITFSIMKGDFVRLEVFNILGQKVTTLVDKPLAVGEYKVRFNAVDLPAGIYFYRLTAGNLSEVKKMILIK